MTPHVSCSHMCKLDKYKWTVKLQSQPLAVKSSHANEVTNEYLNTIKDFQVAARPKLTSEISIKNNLYHHSMCANLGEPFNKKHQISLALGILLLLGRYKYSLHES